MEGVRYIFSKGDLKQNDFSIVFKNETNNYIPAENIKELYLFNDCTLTTKFLNFLSKKKIVLHVFNYYGNYCGSYVPTSTLLSGKVTVKQAEAYLNNREVIARSIVQGIADNMYTILYHYYRHGVKEIKPTIDYLRKDVKRLLDKTTSINQVLMIEGNIWMKFYDSFQYFLPPDFIMNKRVKRPPNNPINALISFGNSILYTKTISQIYQTHLNQTISFLHEPSDARFSLSLDLAEVFKPCIVFKTIFKCLNKKMLTVEKHFEQNMNYCILNEEGKKIFLKELDNALNETFEHSKLHRKVSYLTAIKIDGYKLIKYLIEGKEFIPFSEEVKY